MMHGRRRALTVLVLALLVGALAMGRGPALAVGTLDASFTPSAQTFNPFFAGSIGGWGETFVAGRGGVVDRAGLQFIAVPAPAPMVFMIYATSNGLPTGNPLAQQVATVPADAFVATWVEVDFDTPATVLAGQSYALIALKLGGPVLSLAGQLGNPYPGGQTVAFDSSTPWIPYADVDVGFRIYISPAPAPRYTLTAAATPNPAPLNQPLSFGFTAANTGTAAGAATVLTATLPAGVQQQGAITVVDSSSAPVPGASCTLRTGSQVSCALGSVPVGAAYTVTMPARIVSGTLGSQYCARGILSGGIASVNTSTATAQACLRSIWGGDLVSSVSCPERLTAPVWLAEHCTVTVRNIGGTAVALLPGHALVRVTLFPGTMPNQDLLAPSPVSGYSPQIASPFPAAAVEMDWIATAMDSIPPGGSRAFVASPMNAGQGGYTIVHASVANPFGLLTEASLLNNTSPQVRTFIEAAPPP